MSFDTYTLVDTRGFDAFIKALSDMSGKPRPEVLRQQAGAVLDLCITRSPGPKKVADVKRAIEVRITKPGRYIGDSGTLVDLRENRAPRPIPYSTLQTLTGTRGGRNGDEWYVGLDRRGKRVIVHGSKMLGNEKYHRRQGIRDNLYRNADKEIKEALNAVGSIKNSWVQVADAIGAPLRKVPAYLKRRRQQRFNDGASSKMVVESTQQFIEIVNTNRQLIGRYNGARILQGAIETRLKAFERDIKNDVFADITVRAQRYPGIFVI